MALKPLVATVQLLLSTLDLVDSFYSYTMGSVVSCLKRKAVKADAGGQVSQPAQRPRRPVPRGLPALGFGMRIHDKGEYKTVQKLLAYEDDPDRVDAYCRRAEHMGLARTNELTGRREYLFR